MFQRDGLRTKADSWITKPYRFMMKDDRAGHFMPLSHSPKEGDSFVSDGFWISFLMDDRCIPLIRPSVVHRRWNMARIHCNFGLSFVLKPRSFALILDCFAIKPCIFVIKVRVLVDSPRSQREGIMIQQLVLSKIPTKGSALQFDSELLRPVVEGTRCDRYREFKTVLGPSIGLVWSQIVVKDRASAETLGDRKPDRIVLSIPPLREMMCPCLKQWQKKSHHHRLPLKTSQKGKTKWVLSKPHARSQIPFVNALALSIVAAHRKNIICSCCRTIYMSSQISFMVHWYTSRV